MQSQENKEWIPTNPDYDPNKPMQVGGQAVIEGVMMRAPGSVATAVRRANGQIVVQQQVYKSVTEKYKWLNVPIVRGAVGLIDMMYLGIKTLNFSAEIAMLDVEIEEVKNNGAVGKNNSESKTKSHPKSQTKSQSKLVLIATLVFALALGIGIFFVIPLYLTTKVFAIEQTAMTFNFVAGAIRITILLLYMAGISFMKDIQQLFRYHGAEHKSVFAYELKGALVPNSVIKYSRFHPRCGTSFLLIVAFVAILSFSLLDAFLLMFLTSITLPIRLLTHLPFIPIVGGLAYEIIKFSAKHGTTWWGRLLIAPGLWLQRITTKEPTESQIEVALVALKCALGQDDPAKYILQPIPVTVSSTSLSAKV
ncbi:MAG: DUF1385 domain-containing protein [Ignavibacteriales bacterium]|nr:DUF1385 domain-containing protein [Ignavibacteriales bacterium]